MIQKIKILEASLDKLDELNSNKFIFEKFKEANLQIETILIEVKSSLFDFGKIEFTKDDIHTIKNLLNKIDKLEGKILPKANLLETFSKSKS